ncbi:unnamed protein product [Blepharisma stoltei]|uniref:Uncharacterized protein n=1 Tax=Blepharisma stoltei TaxID=1481888 RepID=A0AAU9IZR4_9CILI|nr:unnamed protein product [Blepharisma stoltei]
MEEIKDLKKQNIDRPISCNCSNSLITQLLMRTRDLEEKLKRENEAKIIAEKLALKYYNKLIKAGLWR